MSALAVQDPMDLCESVLGGFRFLCTRRAPRGVFGDQFFNVYLGGRASETKYLKEYL